MYTYRMHTFEVFPTIEAAWKMFTKRAWYYIGITLLVFFLGWLIGFVSGFYNALLGQDLIGNAIGFALSFLGQTLLGMGTVAFFLRAHDTADAEVWDLWHPQPLWNYIGAVVVNGIATIVGLILLIVPGVVVALMFFFAQYLVIDRSLTPIVALQESMRITNGHKWKLLGLVGVLTLINIFGALLLLIGLLVTIPLTSLAIVHAYRILGGHGHSHTHAQA
jgi:uncharacterized membrane protein